MRILRYIAGAPEAERLSCLEQELLPEQPLAIQVDGKPYAVVMRTPGDELAHAAGFCLSEGIIGSTADYTSLACCDFGNENIVSLTLTQERRRAVGDILKRHSFTSQSSCGICGKQMLEDIFSGVEPISSGGTLQPDAAIKALQNISTAQPLRKSTKTSHAALLYSGEWELLTVAEDVGRHNALDKAVGRLFLDENLEQAKILLLSSRVSYEMVIKAARARIPFIFSLSRPTQMAVELCQGLNLTLANLEKGGCLYIYSHAQRLAQSKSDEPQLAMNCISRKPHQQGSVNYD